MKKSKIKGIFQIVVLSFLFFALTMSVIPILANPHRVEYPVTLDSDVDSVENIGINASSYSDATIKDGVYQNLSEQMEDYTENTSQTLFPSGRMNNHNIVANRKGVGRWQVPEERTVHTLSLWMEPYAGNVEVRMGIYNSSAGTGANNAPTDLVGETDSRVISQGTGFRWENFTFSTPVTLGIYQYWVGFHSNDSMRVKRTAWLLFGAYTRYYAVDSFSDGLEDPFGSYSERDGGGYRQRIYYSHTVQSYQLTWEHQAEHINTNWDYYKICMYGYVTNQEEFAVQVWDWDGQGGGDPMSWEDWGVGIYTQYWKINETTPQWYNFSLFQNTYSNITWRYTDNYEDSTTLYGDSVQSTLHIDYAGVFGYTYSMDVIEDFCGRAESIHPGEGFVPIDGNYININISAGETFDIRGKGNTFPDPWIYASNSSDTANAVPLMVWGVGTVIYTEEDPTNETLYPVWIFFKVPTPSVWGDYDGNYSVTLTFYAGGESDTIQCNFTVLQQSGIPVFIKWFDPDYLIPHRAPIVFWCDIYDRDNDSSELNVTLWTSQDKFIFTNYSHSMTFHSDLRNYTSHFIKQWEGKPEGTNYWYYFTVYDGNVTVWKPPYESVTSGVFFKVTWDMEVKAEEEPDRPLLITEGTDLTIFYSMVLLILILLICVYYLQTKGKFTL